MGVAIVGSTVRDVVYLPGREPVRSPGGSPLFAARRSRPWAAARRRHALRRPRAGGAIAELAAPLCLRLDASVMTSELRYRPDGERDHALASLGTTWSEDDVTGWAAPALRGATWIHAGTQRGGDLGPSVLQALAAGGRHIALDAQGPLRLPQLGPIVLGGALDAALLRHVQALKLGEEEALAAFGTIDAAAIRARARCPR